MMLVLEIHNWVFGYYCFSFRYGFCLVFVFLCFVGFIVLHDVAFVLMYWLRVFGGYVCCFMSGLGLLFVGFLS